MQMKSAVQSPRADLLQAQCNLLNLVSTGSDVAPIEASRTGAAAVRSKPHMTELPSESSDKPCQAMAWAASGRALLICRRHDVDVLTWRQAYGRDAPSLSSTPAVRRVLLGLGSPVTAVAALPGDCFVATCSAELSLGGAEAPTERTGAGRAAIVHNVPPLHTATLTAALF